ncbi:hypothetical protein E4U44_005281 [Claviceps purpurea]|nr:hypothetical protein E4U44_005281 [Claviceps purpurea]
MAPTSPLPFAKSRPITAVSPEHPPVTEHRIKVFPSQVPDTPGHDDDDGCISRTCGIFQGSYWIDW